MIRHAISKDFYDIMNIENSSFRYPYTESEMISMLASNTTKVIESKEIIVGYMSYRQTAQGNYLIEALGIHPKFQKNGFGAEFIKDIKNLAHGKSLVEKVVAYVAEFNTEGHLFFKKNGFKCTRIVKNRYGCDELSYRFVWRKDGN